MDRSYIVRIYKQEKESVMGIVENVEQNKRFGFSNANELWDLIINVTQEHIISNVIKLETTSPTKIINACSKNKVY